MPGIQIESFPGGDNYTVEEIKTLCELGNPRCDDMLYWSVAANRRFFLPEDIFTQTNLEAAKRYLQVARVLKYTIKRQRMKEKEIKETLKIALEEGSESLILYLVEIGYGKELVAEVKGNFREFVVNFELLIRVVELANREFDKAKTKGTRNFILNFDKSVEENIQDFKDSFDLLAFELETFVRRAFIMKEFATFLYLTDLLEINPQQFLIEFYTSINCNFPGPFIELLQEAMEKLQGLHGIDFAEIINAFARYTAWYNENVDGVSPSIYLLLNKYIKKD